MAKCIILLIGIASGMMLGAAVFVITQDITGIIRRKKYEKIGKALSQGLADGVNGIDTYQFKEIANRVNTHLQELQEKEE